MAFQGSLRELPLPDVIQLVAVSGKTGAFTLRNRAENGRIYLRKGQIVHATVGSLAGEQAVYELARWSEGEFSFTPEEETQAVSIEKSNTNLLMEAARQIDEWKILSKKIGSTRMVPVAVSKALLERLTFAGKVRPGNSGKRTAASESAESRSATSGVAPTAKRSWLMRMSWKAHSAVVEESPRTKSPRSMRRPATVPLKGARTTLNF